MEDGCRRGRSLFVLGRLPRPRSSRFRTPETTPTRLGCGQRAGAPLARPALGRFMTEQDRVRADPSVGRRK